MFKKIYTIFTILLLAGLVITSCQKSGKDAVKESCNCMKTVLDKKFSDVSKFHDEIRKCQKDFVDKYQKRMDSDAKFKQEVEAEAKECSKDLQKKYEQMFSK